VFEQISVGRIAAATVAQQQDRRRVWVALFANTIPAPLKAVGGELARLMRQAQVDVPAIAEQIVDAVGNHFPVGPTGKVMIEGVERIALWLEAQGFDVEYSYGGPKWLSRLTGEKFPVGELFNMVGKVYWSTTSSVPFEDVQEHLSCLCTGSAGR